MLGPTRLEPAASLCLTRASPANRLLRGETPITGLHGSNASAGCPEGFTTFKLGLGSAAYLCATLEDNTDQITNAPRPIGRLEGTMGGPKNATVCHGYVCTAAQQGELCPKGTPGAAQDFRCCSGKWLKGPTPDSPAPLCSSVPSAPPASKCPGFSCAATQQGSLCKKGTPGASDRDFRCCAGRWIEGPSPGSPAPPCGPLSTPQCPENWDVVPSLHDGAPFAFPHAHGGKVLLCTQRNPAPPPPCPPAPPPSTQPITKLQAIVASTPAGACCPAGLERVGASLVTNTNPKPCGNDSWNGDFNSGAGGKYVYLCFGRGSGSGAQPLSPISSLGAFTTPSDADPFMDCPSGWSKVSAPVNNTYCQCLGSPNDKDDCANCEDFNSGSKNVGAMYLCYKRQENPPLGSLAASVATASLAAITSLSAVTGNRSTCPPGLVTVPAVPRMKPAGPFDFNAAGGSIWLCAQLSSGHEKEW